MPRRSGPPGCAWTVSNTSTSLGPTYIRSRVRPEAPPNATPSTGALSFGPSAGFSGFLGMSTRLWSVTRTASLGDSGMNAAAKYESAVAAQLNGPLSVWPPTTHDLPVKNQPDCGDLWAILSSCCHSISLRPYNEIDVWSPNPPGHSGNACIAFPLSVTWVSRPITQGSLSNLNVLRAVVCPSEYSKEMVVGAACNPTALGTYIPSFSFFSRFLS